LPSVLDKGINLALSQAITRHRVALGRRAVMVTLGHLTTAECYRAKGASMHDTKKMGTATEACVNTAGFA